MLVFPQWRPDAFGEGCRVPRWMPAERFAPYVARPVVLPPQMPQVEDEETSGDSSPERGGPAPAEAVQCQWRGCGLWLPSVARLSAHVARAHAQPRIDGLFYCGWSNCTRPQKGFNARYKMLVHVRTHTNERPHTCNQCNKSFSRAENLKIHLRSHSGEKPYVCPYEGCGKAYSNSSDRFKHTRTHTVDKPYYCKVIGCNKRYTDPSSLRKHVKTYKHFTPKDPPKQDSSDETQSSENYLRETNSFYPTIKPISPQLPISHTPPERNLSPTIPPYNPVLPMAEVPISTIEYPAPYVRPLEPLYPLRIPANEMSYIEYTQMYEHAYRSYYSNGVNLLRPNISEKSYCYEDVTMENVKEHEIPVRYSPVEELPLNLKCEKRIERKPIENLVRHIDLPLDLSIRTSIESIN